MDDYRIVTLEFYRCRDCGQEAERPELIWHYIGCEVARKIAAAKSAQGQPAGVSVEGGRP